MKKEALTLVIFLISATAFGQIEKGTWVTGGSFSMGYATNQDI